MKQKKKNSHENLPKKKKKMRKTYKKYLKELEDYYCNNDFDPCLEDDPDRISNLEQKLAENYKNLIQDDDFYQIPADNFYSIIDKIEFIDEDNFVSEIKTIIQKADQYLSSISGLLFNNIHCPDVSFQTKDIIDIFSAFSTCDICNKIKDHLENEIHLALRDYRDEFKKKDEEIQDLQKEIVNKETQIQDLRKSLEILFSPLTEKPIDFESNLFRAVRSDKLSSVRYLIENEKIDLETINSYSETPFIAACFSGKLSIITYLAFLKNADIHAQNQLGWEGIHVACREGHLEIVKYLIENIGINCNTPDSDGSLPIHHACEKGHLDIVKYLIEEQGVSPEAAGEFKCTPLHEACKYNQIEIVRYLIEERNVSKEPVDEDNWTPLRWACRNGCLKTVQYLIEYGKLPIDSVDQFEDTYLHTAAEHGRYHMIKYLLQQGAIDINRNALDQFASDIYPDDAKYKEKIISSLKQSIYKY